jgi:hypothetical protein
MMPIGFRNYLRAKMSVPGSKEGGRDTITKHETSTSRTVLPAVPSKVSAYGSLPPAFPLYQRLDRAVRKEERSLVEDRQRLKL